jgi:DNA (cytosine-5)-methyltransferase 1
MSAQGSHSLVLSLFPGIDLFGRAFEEEGFCVVRGPDVIWGGDIRRFVTHRGVFNGIIGGPPCQDFSSLRRCEPSGQGQEMLNEFARVVTQAEPVWFLMENVPGVPTVAVDGYVVQRLNLMDCECGGVQWRLRTFQFGQSAREGCLRKDRIHPLVIRRQRASAGQSPAAIASEGRRKVRRGWGEFCQLQGLPPDFDLPGMTKSAKYAAVGNGVPLTMGRVLARAVNAWTVTTELQRVCICDCGRPVPSGRTLATPACRKRMQRRRDAAGVIVTGPVTPDLWK